MRSVGAEVEGVFGFGVGDSLADVADLLIAKVDGLSQVGAEISSDGTLTLSVASDL